MDHSFLISPAEENEREKEMKNVRKFHRNGNEMNY